MNKYLSDIEKINTSQLHLIALSGGCDSVVLLRLLLDEGFRLHAVHCNFHLRGQESDRDEQFCRLLCAEWQVPLTVKHFNTQDFAANQHISIEMAARQERYEYFETLRTELKADRIFVGTHADDAVETFFINLLRGTGIEGLAGIKAQAGNVVRPLLHLTKNQLRAYAEEKGLRWMEDSTNADTHILRNGIRHELLPLFQNLSENAITGIRQTIANLSSQLPLLQEITREKCNRLFVDGKIGIVALLREPSAEWLLYSILKSYGFTSATTKSIFRQLPAQQGKKWYSEQYILQVHESHLILIKKEEKPLSKIAMQRMPYTENFVIPHSHSCVALDAGTIHFPVSIRKSSPGMRFTPIGMKGSKLINDYLAEHHVPATIRHQQDILIDSAGEVLWLIGHTINHHHRITSNTREVLLCSLTATLEG